MPKKSRVKMRRRKSWRTVRRMSNPPEDVPWSNFAQATALARQRLETIRQYKWATRKRQDNLALSPKHTMPTLTPGLARTHRSPWAIHVEEQYSIKPYSKGKYGQAKQMNWRALSGHEMASREEHLSNLASVSDPAGLCMPR